MRDSFRKKLIIQTCGVVAVLYLFIYLLRHGLLLEKRLPKFSAIYINNTAKSPGLKVIKLNREADRQHDYYGRGTKAGSPPVLNESVNKNSEYSFGDDPSLDFKEAMDKLNKEDGFFVECGAFTGERSSNSLFFEKTRNWSGLLVEADPLNYAILKTKNRKAYSINACLNTKPYPEMVTFNQARQTGRLVHNKEIENWMKTHRRDRRDTTVQCFPLYSLLLALNKTRVDFFSLDVEGDELYVLQTIPYDKIDIRMMTVEFAHVKSGKESIRSYLRKQGYESLIEVVRQDWGANDIIFRKKK